MFSFLKKENEEEKSSNTSDLVTLVVIAILATSGYFWYQFEKEAKAEALKVAEQTYQQNKLEEAHHLFCQLAEECPASRAYVRNLLSPIFGNYGVSDSAMDKVIFTRYETLDSISANRNEHFQKAEDAVKTKDLLTLKQELLQIQDELFLDSNQKESLVEWRKLAP